MGAQSFLLLLAMAGSPELPGRADREGAFARTEAPAMSSAVELGARWGVVTSVRRSPAHNRAVGGAPGSFHLAGRAIDIARRPGVRHAAIEAAYRNAGYVLVESLDEGDHSHFAFGNAHEKRPAARISVRFATAEPTTAPACSATDASALGRRRPGQEHDCLKTPEPETRYKPLETAP